jgi:hypothetical protein
MDLTDTLWLDAFLTDEFREGGYRRDRIKGYWNGYSSPVLDTTDSDEAVRDDIRRRERMAEACYDV